DRIHKQLLSLLKMVLCRYFFVALRENIIGTLLRIFSSLSLLQPSSPVSISEKYCQPQKGNSWKKSIHFRPQAYPGHRIHAKMTLQVQKRFSSHISELFLLQKSEAIATSFKASHIVKR